MEYKQTEAQPPNPMAMGLDNYIEWDEKDMQDQSCTPSPTTVLDAPTQGEAVEETAPMRQNRCLVSECVIKARAVPPHKHMPVAEGKETPRNESVPADDKEQPQIVAEDEIVELYAGMEEL